MRGMAVSGGVPVWAAVLAAAGGDPLRAMEIEAGLSQEWWERWVAWTEERGRAMELEAAQARRMEKERR